MEAAAVRDGGLDAAWTSSRPSACLARLSLSSYDAKFVMAERTGVGSRLSHRAKRTSIFAEVPVSSGGRRQRDLISVRASDGLWSLSGWLDKSRIIWTHRSAEGENFCRRNALRPWYSISPSPFASSQVDICGKIVSGWRRGRGRLGYGMTLLSEGGIVIRRGETILQRLPSRMLRA